MLDGGPVASLLWRIKEIEEENNKLKPMYAHVSIRGILFVSTVVQLLLCDASSSFTKTE